MILSFPAVSGEVREKELKLGKRELIALDFMTLNERIIWAGGKLISSTCFYVYQVIVEMKSCRQMPLHRNCVLDNYIWKKIKDFSIESNLSRGAVRAPTSTTIIFSQEEKW